jgi:biopolymer transport protein ExbD
MFSAVFMRESGIDVSPARAPELEEMKEARVSIVMDKDGQVWLQGQPCTLSDLEYRVDDLIGDAKDKRVLLKIDRDQQQRDFGDVLMALSNAGADIILLGQKEGKNHAR